MHAPHAFLCSSISACTAGFALNSCSVGRQAQRTGGVRRKRNGARHTAPRTRAQRTRLAEQTLALGHDAMPRRHGLRAATRHFVRKCARQRCARHNARAWMPTKPATNIT